MGNVKEKLSEIELSVIELWSVVGIDRPSNHDEIVQFIFEDVNETADPIHWNSADVSIAFRRWIESKMSISEIDEEDEDLAETQDNIWREVRNDFEDEEEGVTYVDGFLTVDDEDEVGKVIAKVNVRTKAIEYLDDRARTDSLAQEKINELTNPKLTRTEKYIVHIMNTRYADDEENRDNNIAYLKSLKLAKLRILGDFKYN